MFFSYALFYLGTAHFAYRFVADNIKMRFDSPAEERTEHCYLRSNSPFLNSTYSSNKDSPNSKATKEFLRYDDLAISCMMPFPPRCLDFRSFRSHTYGYNSTIRGTPSAQVFSPPRQFSCFTLPTPSRQQSAAGTTSTAN